MKKPISANFFWSIVQVSTNVTQASTGAANVDDGCHSALLTSSTAHAEVIENPTSRDVIGGAGDVIENPMPYDVLRRASSSRLSQRVLDDDNDDDVAEVHIDDERVVAGG